MFFRERLCSGRERMRGAIPDYLLPTTLNIPTEVDRESGKYKVWDASFWLPLGNEIDTVVKIANGEPVDTRLLGPGPLATAAYEYFSGRKWYNPKSAVVPDGSSPEEANDKTRRNMLENLIPGIPFLPGSRAWNRIHDAEDQGAEMLKRLVGFNPKEVNVPESQTRLILSLKGQVREAQKRIGQIERDVRYTPEQKAAYIKAQERYIETLAAQIEKAGKYTGFPPKKATVR